MNLWTIEHFGSVWTEEKDGDRNTKDEAQSKLNSVTGNPFKFADSI